MRYIIDQVLVPLIRAQNLYNGGYNIYTTLDLNLEKKVEQIAYDHLYKQVYDPYLGSYGPLNIQNNVNNAAVVVLDPSNGEILAMDGSANYNDQRLQVRGLRAGHRRTGTHLLASRGGTRDEVPPRPFPQSCRASPSPGSHRAGRQ